MLAFLKRLLWITSVHGLDPLRAAAAIRGVPAYLRDLRELRRQERRAKEPFGPRVLFPFLFDRYQQSGTAMGQYFHHDLWVAQRIFLNRPQRHVDVGSRIDGFVAHVAAFREIEVFDVRPLAVAVPNIKFRQVDLMKDIPPELSDYCDSLSCLSALEHFGLGRYGDPLNYDGHVLGLKSMRQVLRQGGKFYLAVPIGPQRLEFNAHRVFSLTHLLRLVEHDFRMDQFCYVDDKGALHADVKLTAAAIETSIGCRYGAAILEMTKLP